MMQKYLAIIFLILIGCRPIEPVNFVEIQNVKINSSTDNQINISAEIVLDNPNKVKIIIENIDVDIYAEDIILVDINENESRELSESSETTVNITGEVNLKNLEEFLNKKGLAIILGGDDVSLKFIGSIRAKAYGIKDEIDINYTINSVKGLIK
tara:strand:- start:1340 stop:1801 length:462 start_codon:yes stop_codon:yes gene_type:complete